MVFIPLQHFFRQNRHIIFDREVFVFNAFKAKFFPLFSLLMIGLLFWCPIEDFLLFLFWSNICWYNHMILNYSFLVISSRSRHFAEWWAFLLRSWFVFRLSWSAGECAVVSRLGPAPWYCNRTYYNPSYYKPWSIIINHAPTNTLSPWLSRLADGGGMGSLPIFSESLRTPSRFLLYTKSKW